MLMVGSRSVQEIRYDTVAVICMILCCHALIAYLFIIIGGVQLI